VTARTKHYRKMHTKHRNYEVKSVPHKMLLTFSTSSKKNWMGEKQYNAIYVCV